MKTYVIAEAGTGHYSIHATARSQHAIDFIITAAEAGADAVKFQMFVLGEPLFCPLPGDDERMKRWARTCLSLGCWKILQGVASEYKIDLLWSVFQPTCVGWLKELRPRYVKVASRAAEDFPYKLLPGPFLISDGMAASDIMPCVPCNSTFLQCASEYPAPLEKAGYDQERGRFHAGLSDHSGTIWPGLDAIAHGARFLEVHFKIPGADMGNDEPVCLAVEQLKLLCEARDAFAAMHPG